MLPARSDGVEAGGRGGPGIEFPATGKSRLPSRTPRRHPPSFRHERGGERRGAPLTNRTPKNLFDTTKPICYAASWLRT